MIRLMPVVDRYGPEIEWDLAAVGVDLLDFFRGVRPWRQLRRLLSQLMEHQESHFVAAQKTDPDLVANLAERLAQDKANGKRRKPWRPRAVGWSQDTELIARLLDRTGELLSVMADQPVPNGKRKNKPPKPFPRPETAHEKAELIARTRYFESLDADVREAQERYRQQQQAAG